MTHVSAFQEEGEGEEEAYEYDSPASAANIFSNYRPITPPDITEQAISFRLKGENDDDLISNEPSSPPRALKQDLVLKQFTDIMLADMRQIQDPLLLMKLRRDVTDLVFKAVEEDAKRSQIENRKELYCQQMLPRMQMSSEPCSSGGSGPSTYMKNSRKQRRANRSQRLPTGGGGGGGGGAGAGGAGAAGEEWRESMCELNSSVAQVKTETESLEEMDIPGFFPAINLEGNHEG
ncbi:hypothetical protein N1851_018034 [Merluccius polli]|uniref:Uncharacterized protein n=1 Tax=Merluccius polli TaxID=89951 RepID=A0AA47MNQ6_MERPO|nr:hypothetical protein N1851_018034 [Merluccius polli]